jgi:hypothetical protein
VKRRTYYVVVDVNGAVCLGLLFATKEEASDVARHPKRRVMRLVEGGLVRKSPSRRRGGKP